LFKSVDVKAYYEDLYNKYNNITYIKTDPIELVYTLDGNKEYVAFISSIFSYGKVKI